VAASPSRLHRRLLLLAFLFGLAALVLAAIGLRAAHLDEGRAYAGDWTLLLFESIALLGFEPPGDPADRSTVPALALARVLVVLFTLFVVSGVVLELYPPARDGLRRLHFWWIRTTKKDRAPVLLVGLGRIGRTLAPELRGDGRPVYAIDRRDVDEEEAGPHPGDVLRIAGDARDELVRSRACLRSVREAFIATGDDARNVEIAGDILLELAGTGEGRADGLDCYVHVSDPSLATVVRAQGLLDARGHGLTFHTFSDRALAAHQLFLDLLLERGRGFLAPNRVPPAAGAGIRLALPRDGEVLHLVLVGFGVTGQTLALYAARFAHAASGLRPRLTVYGDEAGGRQAWAAFLDRHPAFAPPDLDLASPLFGTEDGWGERPGRPENPTWRTATPLAHPATDPAAVRRPAAVEYAVNAEFRAWPGYVSAGLIDELVARLRPRGRTVRAAVIVCGEEDRRNFEMGLALQHALEGRVLDAGPDSGAIPICVYLPSETGLAALVARPGRSGAAGTAAPLAAFGQRDQVVNYGAITRGLIRSHAEGLRRVHQLLSGRVDVSDSGVAIDLDDSNTDAVLFAEVKFEAVGIRFFPGRLSEAEAAQRGVRPTPLLETLFTGDLPEAFRRAGRILMTRAGFESLPPPLQERLAVLGRIESHPDLDDLLRDAVARVIRRFAAELREAGRDADLAAEMEHNRWMGERLSKNWRYGPHDTPRRQRPTLVPWSHLGEDERHFDRQQLPRLVAVQRELVILQPEEGAFAYVEPA
jgi:hypothetical protein